MSVLLGYVLPFFLPFPCFLVCTKWDAKEINLDVRCLSLSNSASSESIIGRYVLIRNDSRGSAKMPVPLESAAL